MEDCLINLMEFSSPSQIHDKILVPPPHTQEILPAPLPSDKYINMYTCLDNKMHTYVRYSYYYEGTFISHPLV